MENTKFYHLFSSLNAAEKRALKKWVHSPIANQHEEVSSVFDYLFSKKYLNGSIIQKEKVFRHLYPKRSYDDLRFRHLLANCTKCLENFLCYHEFLSDKNASSVYLIKALEKHHQDKYAIALLSEKKQAHDSAIYDSNSVFAAIEMEKTEFNLHSKNTRDKGFNLQKISDLLHQYTQTELLKIACLAVTHQQLSAVQYSFPLLNEILKNTEINYDTVSLAHKIYYMIYRSLTEHDNEATILGLKEILLTASNHFLPEELRDIYLLTINQCIKKLNSGNAAMASIAYELYQLLIKADLLLQNNELDRFAFTNIVFTGLMVKDFKGIEKFITRNAAYLPDEYRESIVSMATARLYYTQQLYKKAVTVLLQTQFNDFLMSISARLLLTKIYIETNDVETAGNHISAFKKYLQKQKNIGYHKERILKFLASCTELISLQYASKKQRKILEAQLSNDDSLIEKQWLLEQLKKSL